jgi:DNA-directed RNA polymerase subunit M
MHTEGDTWVCRACEHEEMRDSQAEAPMATQERQQDDGAPDVADVTQGTTETMQEPCPAADCDSDRAYYEMMPKPGGSYAVVHLHGVRPQVARDLTVRLANHAAGTVFRCGDSLNGHFTKGK